MQLKHPTQKGKVTIAKHNDDIAYGTLQSILTQNWAEIARLAKIDNK